jgi:hypothetical protein
MVRRTPAQYETPPIDFDHVPFDEDALRRILVEAGVRTIPDATTLAAASERLNHAAILLKVKQGVSEAPTATSERQTLQRIFKLASALRAELPIAYDESLFEADDGPGDNPRVIAGVTRLFMHTMDRLMQERVAQDKDERGNGAEADEIFGAENVADALLKLVALLEVLEAATLIELERRRTFKTVKSASPLAKFVREADLVFRALTGRTRLSLSRHPTTREPRGPLIQFVEACCRHVGAPPTERETLVTWLRSRQAGKPQPA